MKSFTQFLNETKSNAGYWAHGTTSAGRDDAISKHYSHSLTPEDASAKHESHLIAKNPGMQINRISPTEFRTNHGGEEHLSSAYPGKLSHTKRFILGHYSLTDVRPNNEIM